MVYVVNILHVIVQGRVGLVKPKSSLLNIYGFEQTYYHLKTKTMKVSHDMLLVSSIKTQCINILPTDVLLVNFW